VNVSLYIARRYLFAKKSHHAINLISGISVCGVALATMALICTLSVFNGFRDLVATFFTAFDPELKITAVEGKVFRPDGAAFEAVKGREDVAVFSTSLQENVMVQYQGRQAMAVLKGVEDNFEQLTEIDSILYGRGEFTLHDEAFDYVVPGMELVSILGTGVRFLDPLEVYAPLRGAKINMANPASSLSSGNLYSAGLAFAVNQQKYDAAYLLTSMRFARRLFGYTDEVSSVELRLTPNASVERTKAEIRTTLGDAYRVEDRYEQQADTFRIMEVEKFISYLFLTFILIIACCNVIGSLSMLIIDKRDDVVTLRRLGADNRLIARIFLLEGSMISFFGAAIGLVLGLVLCLVQQHYGLITLGNEDTVGSFVVDAYPVSVHAGDVALVFVTVVAVGMLAVYYPVKVLTRRLLDRV
jgi:lipoprotein-releasing system permease protein